MFLDKNHLPSTQNYLSKSPGRSIQTKTYKNNKKI